MAKTSKQKALESEIAEMAESLAGGKKRRSRSAAAKKPATKKTATKKPAPKKAPVKKSATAKPTMRGVRQRTKATATKAKKPLSSDVTPRKQANKSAKKATVTTSSTPAPSAVKVRVVPAPAKPTTPKPAAKPAPVPKAAKPAPKKPSAPKAVTANVRIATPRPAKHIAIETPIEREAGEISRAPKELDETPPVANGHYTAFKPVHRRPHALRIFDTQTYHMPLSVDRHHRRSILPFWAWMLSVIVAAVVVILVYIFWGDRI